MSVTTTQASNVLASCFGSTNFTYTPVLHLGLSKSPINADGSGPSEPTGNYARAQILNGLGEGSWQSLTAGQMSNVNEISFVESTTEWASSATPITHIFMANAGTGVGTAVLYYATLSSSRAIPANTTIYFAANSLTITLA